jgi:hypothetical protein
MIKKKRMTAIFNDLFFILMFVKQKKAFQKEDLYSLKSIKITQLQYLLQQLFLKDLKDHYSL